MTTMTAKQTSTTQPATKIQNSLLAAKDLPTFRFDAPMVDVRGWKAVSSDGVGIGSVDRVLVDTAAGLPRYLSISSPDTPGHLLLPVGIAVADREKREVRVSGMNADRIKPLPRLTSSVVSAEYERDLIGSITGATGNVARGEGMYADPTFDVGHLFGPKQPTHKA